MKKKNIRILLVSFGVALLIPISVLAVSNVIERIPVVNDSNNNIRNELLQEKQQYCNNTINENYNISTYAIQEDTELINKINEIDSETEEIENTIIKVMNKFYPSEFSEVKQKLDNNEDNAENQLYELIVNVLETKELTNDESGILKQFIKDQCNNINENTELKARIETICNE